ncbi:hypothetical protein Acr_00g0064800 [Actinidia rufa]|uniref:Uncharacterized protein n=1 Tax=Actinidia rufa TaxID=165716 RepID=A0A7J0DPM3_9ERIC|nr:hypothetical protein Acr_00g0064800 [Actinidia rufa]
MVGPPWCANLMSAELFAYGGLVGMVTSKTSYDLGWSNDEWAHPYECIGVPGCSAQGSIVIVLGGLLQLAA